MRFRAKTRSFSCSRTYARFLWIDTLIALSRTLARDWGMLSCNDHVSVKFFFVEHIKIYFAFNYVIEKNIACVTKQFLLFLLIYFTYHNVAIFIKISLLIRFAKFHFAREYPYSYFTLILFVTLSHVICSMLARLLLNLWGLMLLYRFPAHEVAAPNQWNTQIISISFSARRSLSQEERSCALEAILAVLMVCIIHIGEPNRIGIPSPPTMPFLSIPMYVPMV